MRIVDRKHLAVIVDRRHRVPYHRTVYFRVPYRIFSYLLGRKAFLSFAVDLAISICQQIFKESILYG